MLLPASLPRQVKSARVAVVSRNSTEVTQDLELLRASRIWQGDTTSEDTKPGGRTTLAGAKGVFWRVMGKTDYGRHQKATTNKGNQVATRSGGKARFRAGLALGGQKPWGSGKQVLLRKLLLGELVTARTTTVTERGHDHGNAGKEENRRTG